MRFNFRTIFLIWLAWALIMVVYYEFVQARFAPVRPDYAVFWTPPETEAGSQNDKPYLIEPFLNAHVSWDSEYYLSIAVGGYHDPIMRAIPSYYTWSNPQVALQRDQPTWISMNYAFFPFYPYLIRLLAYPLSLFGLNPIATATLSGVLVSMLGTLGAMLALYDMLRDEDEQTGLRAAFYLVIFPAAMFLATIYTEGLFLGLSFGTLALARRKKWLWAALLAACATWTRAAGGLLLLPLGLYWIRDGGLKRIVRSELIIKESLVLLLIGSPLWAYLIFNATLGHNFHIVETMFFSRGLLLIRQSWEAWTVAWDGLLHGPGPMQAYYLVEFAGIFFGIFACIWIMRKDPILGIYGLVTIFFSLTSGGAQGMHRYVMAAPAVFLVPARWGKREAFDRPWTILSILLMGIFAAMFAFDFWAG
ncbi:MAG: hypothetical protein JXB85_11875 [Anaerolineales bacterium]|nr:hypothetical protein [Anaerolineales bacterium]